uniref:response regulator n=1 Tax=Thiolapillus sp. TaxID=2017437 RepID=UPI0025D52FBD
MMKKQTTVTTLPRVLIVDDDAMVRLLAISALGQLDLDLHEAGDGQTCLRPRDRFWGLGCPKI